VVKLKMLVVPKNHLGIVTKSAQKNFSAIKDFRIIRAPLLQKKSVYLKNNFLINYPTKHQNA